MAVPVPSSALDWWSLFNLFLYVGIAAAAITIGAMVYFALKNRSQTARALESIETLSRSRAREAVVFASISTILLFSLAVGSYRMTTSIQNPPSASDSLTINVTAFQWGFKFIYPQNITTTGECTIPSDKPIIFNVTSSDVMHNFGLPDFKLKIDAIPGRYNIIWITAPSVTGNNTLSYQIRCYELCGTGHTYMTGNLVVMSPAAFDQWVVQNTSNMTGGM